MKNKDQILLEQAYDSINEGIWDRVKGQAAGIGAGIKQGAQNIAIAGANKLGAGITPTGKTMGQAYAQKQQKSIFSSFISKAKSEMKEFEVDIQKLGKADMAALEASNPEIKKVIDNYKALLAKLDTYQTTVQSVS